MMFVPFNPRPSYEERLTPPINFRLINYFNPRPHPSAGSLDHYQKLHDSQTDILLCMGITWLDHYQKLHGSQTEIKRTASSEELDHYQKLHGSQTPLPVAVTTDKLDHYQKLHGSQTPGYRCAKYRQA